MSIQTQPSQLQKLKIIENVQARKIIENDSKIIENVQARNLSRLSTEFGLQQGTSPVD